MKIEKVVLVFCFFFLIHVRCTYSQDESNQVSFQTKYGALLVEFNSPIVYRSKGKPAREMDFFGCALVDKKGDQVRYVGSFFETVPPLKLLITSPDAKEENNGKYIVWTFEKNGTIKFSFSIGDESFEKELAVKELPFSINDSSDLLVKAYGVPDQTKEFFVKWPSDEIVDGVFYQADLKERIFSVEHWFFDEMPHCVFAVKDLKIKGIHSLYRPTPKKINVPKPEKKEKTDSPPPKIPVAKWSRKDGSEFFGNVKYYKAPNFVYQDENDGEFDVKISDLSQESLDRARKQIKKTKQ